jgi:hypothetical protein
MYNSNQCVQFSDKSTFNLSYIRWTATSEDFTDSFSLLFVMVSS